MKSFKVILSIFENSLFMAGAVWVWVVEHIPETNGELVKG